MSSFEMSHANDVFGQLFFFPYVLVDVFFQFIQ